MITATEASLRSRLVTVISHLLCGLGLLPVLVYVGGQAVVGPYHGMSGLRSFLGSIYGGLASFELGAWILVTSPSLIVAAWYGATKIQQYLLREDPSGST